MFSAVFHSQMTLFSLMSKRAMVISLSAVGSQQALAQTPFSRATSLISMLDIPSRSIAQSLSILAQPIITIHRAVISLRHLGLTVGLVDGDGFSYEWGQASAAVSHAFTDDVAAYIGANYALNSEDALDFDSTINGDPKGSLLWIGTGISAGF